MKYLVLLAALKTGWLNSGLLHWKGMRVHALPWLLPAIYLVHDCGELSVSYGAYSRFCLLLLLVPGTFGCSGIRAREYQDLSFTIIRGSFSLLLLLLMLPLDVLPPVVDVAESSN
jgi:hypothetical protein